MGHLPEETDDTHRFALHILLWMLVSIPFILYFTAIMSFEAMSATYFIALFTYNVMTE